WEGLQGGVTSAGELRLYVSPHDALLTHELGHIIERRLLAPAVTDSLQTLFEERPPASFTYYSPTGNYPAEYVAETFRMAMEVVRSAAKESRQQRLQTLEQRYPGVTLWYTWLVARLDRAVGSESLRESSTLCSAGTLRSAFEISDSAARPP